MDNLIPTKGIDRPILYCYLAGRISGDCIDQCLSWRHKIVDFYSNYKGKGKYPISFLDALNSKEADSIDAKGLTSSIPPGLIYDKDILSVERADVVVAMMDDYMEEGIQDLLTIKSQDIINEGEYHDVINQDPSKFVDFKKAFYQLQEKIINRRPNWGTDFEVSVAMYLGKPIILIAGNERQKKMLQLHPFMRRASVIVGSVEELLENKWLNIIYKSISSALY